MRAYQFMVTVTEKCRKSAWLQERQIDRLMREDDKQELEASTSTKLDSSFKPLDSSFKPLDSEFKSEVLSAELKEVSSYADAQGLGVGDIVVISSRQCEADWPMRFAVYNVIPGEIMLIPFNNYSEAAGTFEVKMFDTSNPFSRVLVTNALFTADPAKVKCWNAGKMSPKDISLMRAMVKHQMSGVELPQEAKERQGCFANDLERPREFLEYQNELLIVVNRLSMSVQCI